MDKIKISPLITLNFIVFMWGFTGVIGKLISFEAIPLVWGRLFVAVFLVFIYLRFFAKKYFAVKKKLLIQLLLIGTILGSHWVLFFSAIKVSNISIATSTLSTGTLFAAFIEPVVFKRKIRISEVLLSLVIIICIGFIFKTEIQYWIGIVLGIACAFLLTLNSVFNGIVHSKGDSAVLTFYELLGGLFIATLYVTIFGEWESVINIQLLDIVWLIVLGGALTCFPLIMTMKLMKDVSPFTLMLSMNMEPIYAIIIAFLIWGDSERMGTVFYIATGIMILAIILNGYLKSKNSQKNDIKESLIP